MPATPRPAGLRRRVRLSQLELLAALARAPTLSAAAREVNLSQPAASRLLNALAADLGVELFERAGRTLRPTAAGQALLRRAAGLMAELDRTQSELAAIGEGLSGTVSVGAGIGACYVLLPRALARLRTQAPLLAVTMREGPMEELVAKLREGRIDLVVGRLDPTLVADDLLVQEIFDPPTRVVCGPQHPLAGRRKLAWPEVMAQEWILPEAGTPMRGGVERLFRRLRRRPSLCLVESSSIQTNVALMNQRDVLWVLSSDIADYFAALGTLGVLDLPAMRGPSPLTVTSLGDRSPSPSVQRLVDCLRQSGREITGRGRAPPQR